jgi:hypothetical protein
MIYSLIGRSFGGIGNVIQFMINEGLKPTSYDNGNDDTLLENSNSNINSNENKITVTISKSDN